MSCQCLETRDQLITNPPDWIPDGVVPFAPAWALGVPTTSGVYLIFDIRGVLYIGRGSNLRRRFEQHYLASHNEDFSTAARSPVGNINFSWKSMNYFEQVRFEAELIRGFRPLCNSQHNY